MLKSVVRSFRMCDKFSESVSKILSVIEESSNGSVRQVEESTKLKKSPRPFTVLVEGNIGSGKSTYLQHFYSHRNTVDIITEPVDKWRDLNSHNLLQMMYEDPQRWSLTFQTYVQLTMLETHIKSSVEPVKMMERSLYSAKYCFVENLRKTGKMFESEYQVLSSWFDFILTCKEIDLSVDLIVYLQTSPEVALQRVKERSRGEEHLISEEYIRELHSLHEDWLIRQKYPVPAPVVVVDANQDVKDMRLVFEKMSELFKEKENIGNLIKPVGGEDGIEVIEDNKENIPKDFLKTVAVKRVIEDEEETFVKKKAVLMSTE